MKLRLVPTVGIVATAAASIFLAVVASATGSGPDDYDFVEADWGVEFLHAGYRLADGTGIEAAGAGSCVLDFDGDGWEDLFLLNALYRDAALQAERDPRSRLYRNVEGARFEHVAGALDLSAWAMGCAAGDYDRDGLVDVAVNTYGGAYLYRNLGGGRFANVTAAAGIDRFDCEGFACFGTSIAFLDYDKDADLDLYVLNYVEWDGDSHELVVEMKGQCDVLWRNDGDGTFTNVTIESGTADCLQNHFAIAVADANGDGYHDIFLANDGSNDTFLVNRGDGTFADLSLESGLYDMRAGMGAAWGDYDEDGLMDVVVTYFDSQGWGLKHQGPNLTFTDRALEDGLYEPTFNYIGWGVEFADYDLDGHLDLVLVAGAPNVTYSGLTGYGQRNFVLRNEGPGHFVDEPGVWYPEPIERSSRGLAAADFDQDGYLDLVIVNNADEDAEVWTSARGPNNFLQLRLGSNDTVPSQGVGAVVTVEAEGRNMRREVVAQASFGSQSTRDLQFGLGRAARADRVLVEWPDGSTQAFTDVPANRLLALEPGGAPRLVRDRPLVTLAAPATATRVGDVHVVAAVERPRDPALLRWSVDGDVVEGNGHAVDLRFRDLGVHRVRVRVEDASGAWDEDEVEVRVVNVPPTPVVTVPATIVGGAPADFSAESSADADGRVVAYRWLVEGEEHAGPVVRHAFSRPGPAEVRLTVVDDEGSAASTVVVVVVANAPPVVVLAPSTLEPDRVSPARFDATASHDPDGRIVAWRWEFGDGAGADCAEEGCVWTARAAADATSDGGARAAHRYRSLGVVVARLTVVDDWGAAASASVALTVRNLPPTPRIVAYSVANVGQELPYDGSGANDADGRVVAWRWTFHGDSVDAASRDVVAHHAFASMGPKRATLTVLDDEGATASTTVAVEVVDRLAVDVRMDRDAYGPLDRPRGVVDVRFANGLPVLGAKVVVDVVLVVESPGGPVETARWTAPCETDGSGRCEFTVPSGGSWLDEWAAVVAPGALPTGVRAGDAAADWGRHEARAAASWGENGGGGATAYGSRVGA